MQVHLLPHQLALAQALAPAHGRDTRGAALQGGLASGKTAVGAILAIQFALLNKSVYEADGRTPAVIVGSPSYTQARGGSYAAVVQWLRKLGIRHETRFSSGIVDVRFAGTCVAWVSAEHPQAIEGWEPAALWVDEPDSCPKWADPGFTTMNLWLGRLRNPRAKFLRYWFTGTPKGRLRLHEMQFGDDGMGQNALPDLVQVVRARTDDNYHTGTSYAERLRKQYTGRLAQALLDGEIVDLTEGQAYEYFTREEHVKTCQYRPGAPVLAAFDFNRSPLCALLLQRDGDSLCVIREFAVRETTTTAVATAISDYLKSLGHMAGVQIYGDPAGRARSSKSDHSDFDLIRTAMNGVGPVSEHYRAAATTQLIRVNAVNAALRDGKIRIDPSCAMLIRDMIEVAFKPGTSEIEKKNKNLTHASDALGYCVQEALSAGPNVRRI